jgi:type I restriction enzyme, R subunit
MELTESQTRSLLINPQLLAAGWKLSDRTQVRFEVPVVGYDPAPWNGITDFCLYQPSAHVLSVVEAKRASRNPREGEEQLRQYITEIARNQDFAPFGFMGNGLNTWFWEVGLAHPRLVASFFSPADLERLLFIRRNRLPLASIAINTTIVDRAYQHEAIRRVCEAFERGLRRALLAMAIHPLQRPHRRPNLRPRCRSVHIGMSASRRLVWLRCPNKRVSWCKFSRISATWTDFSSWLQQ